MLGTRAVPLLVGCLALAAVAIFIVHTTGRSGVGRKEPALSPAAAAADVSDQLWSSAGCATDAMQPGQFGHFTVPTTADGLVIVPDQSHLDIYGMLQG